MGHYNVRFLALLAIVASAAPSSGEILYGETATITFEDWAANLAPGYTLSQTNIEGRTCYCKTPLAGETPALGIGSAGAQPSGSKFEFVFTGVPPLYDEGQPESSFDYLYLTNPAARKEKDLL
ncbi:uncharacterized protein LOC135212265 [Macrobrachium nipponense]|uniref:uncharacterized protein LOC135212265 n=1 Tax=Macrobrachium nipponense TaxID=159736 RepID=UPI0030C81220